MFNRLFYYKWIVQFCAVMPLIVIQPNAHAFSLAGTVFDQVGQEKNIDPFLLYAVALCESGFNPASTRHTSPYAWTLRTPDKAIYAKNQTDAERHLERQLKKSRAIDIGLMQINLRWHGHRVAKPTDLLDPLTNLRVGAAILNENFARHPNDLIVAIGQYHSFIPKRSRSYGMTVWRVYQSLKTLNH